MDEAFAALQRPKAYAQIVDQIVDRISSGGYGVGDRLPPERNLAAAFGVSRGTLKEAIRVLEHAGVLEARIGSGTYVAESAGAEDTRVRARAAAVGDFSPLDVLDARLAIEPLSAAAAAQGPSTNLARLQHELTEHEAAIESGSDPTQFDLGFHLEVAAACRNEVFAVQTRQLMDWMSQGTWKQYKAGARERAGERAFVHEHRRVFEAISRHDPDGAAKAMREHLLSIRRSMLEAMELA